MQIIYYVILETLTNGDIVTLKFRSKHEIMDFINLINLLDNENIMIHVKLVKGDDTTNA